MNFADLLRKAAAYTRTENGAVALNTTGDACLDLFGAVGSLRDADESRTFRISLRYMAQMYPEALRENTQTWHIDRE